MRWHTDLAHTLPPCLTLPPCPCRHTLAGPHFSDRGFNAIEMNHVAGSWINQVRQGAALDRAGQSRAERKVPACLLVMPAALASVTLLLAHVLPLPPVGKATQRLCSFADPTAAHPHPHHRSPDLPSSLAA